MKVNWFGVVHKYYSYINYSKLYLLFVDTTKPRAEIVIFGLSGGFATTLLIILVILPCVTAIGCCVYHHRKAGCRGGSYCRVSKKSTVA